MACRDGGFQGMINPGGQKLVNKVSVLLEKPKYFWSPVYHMKIKDAERQIPRNQPIIKTWSCTSESPKGEMINFLLFF